MYQIKCIRKKQTRKHRISQQLQTQFRAHLFIKAASQHQKFSDTTEHNDASQYGRNIETTRTTDTDTIGGHTEDTKPVNPERSSSIARHLLATTETEHQVKGGLLLDVVVRQGAAILKLLTSEDQALLVRGNALLVLDLSLHVVDGVR